MKLARSENAFRNMRAGMASKIISLLCPFIVRTVFIHVLGAEYLGVNSLFSSVLSVLNLSELGFSTAVVFSMYKAIAEDDQKTINALLYFYKRVYLCVGSVILALGLLLIPFLPHLTKGSYPSDINPLVVYLLFLLDTVASYFLFAYKKSILEAFQRSDVCLKVNMLKDIGTKGLQIVLLLTVKNYYVYLAIMPLFTVISNLQTAYYSKKIFPQYHPEGQLSREIKADIKQKVSGLMIQKVCQVSRNSFDSIFVSIYLGLTEIAIYNNYYYIISMVTSFMVIATTAISAGVGNSVATETQEKNIQDMYRINFLYMWISGWCMACLLCLYQPFMKIWVGPELLLPMSSVILFSLYFYSLKMGDVISVYSGAAGLFWHHRYRALCEAAANIFLNWILGKYFGINGIIVATMLSLLVFNFCYGTQIVFQHYFSEQKILRYFLFQLRNLSVTSGICMITYYLCSLLPDNFVFFIVRMMICVIVPNLCYLVVYRKTKSYAEAMPWILDRMHISKSSKISRILIGRG